MKKIGIMLLIIGSLITLEALIKNAGQMTVETAVLSLTIFNLSYVLYLSGEKDRMIKNLTFKDIILKRGENEEKNIITNVDIKEEIFQMLNKFSAVRIKSLLDVTNDPNKRNLLENELKKRKVI